MSTSSQQSSALSRRPRRAGFTSTAGAATSRTKIGLVAGWGRYPLVIAEALRRAKLDRIRTASSDPFHWAAFVTIGDGSVRVPLTPSPNPGVLLMILGAAILVITAGYGLRARRSAEPAQSM